ncbi:Gti1/Pac2 family-domain-containing protein [Obelidium mucronatum]|nr:Gti1/Pac2 family-domain-containing protein [Obelidium mucronatum]
MHSQNMVRSPLPEAESNQFCAGYQDFPETFRGIVADELDALLLIEACIGNMLCAINMNPLSMASLRIQSGSVIVFSENSSPAHMQRWRDGLSWSPSRNQGPFLLYKTLPGSDGLRYRVISYYHPQDVNPLNFSRFRRQQGPVVLSCPSQMSEFRRFLVNIHQTEHVAGLVARAFKESNNVMDSPQSLQFPRVQPQHYQPEQFSTTYNQPPMEAEPYSPPPTIAGEKESYYQNMYYSDNGSYHPGAQACSCGGIAQMQFRQLMHQHAHSNWLTRPLSLAPLRYECRNDMHLG